MIVKTFDNGWGKDWAWKQFESGTVEEMLRSLYTDNGKHVVINSVWYTQEFHHTVMDWLRANAWDTLILVAMLDAAIPKPEWYAEFQRPVIGIGYYPGPNHLDLCAIFVEENMHDGPYGDLGDHTAIDTPFMCLNRKPHWHRRRLYAMLEGHGLLDRGLVSMGSEDAQMARTLPVDCEADMVAPNGAIHHYGIPNSVRGLGHPSNWRRHFLNVVTETVYDINRNNFVSEKIYKPIVGQRPFLVYDPDGGCSWLTQRGFEPYVDDFRDITDLDLREPSYLAPFLKTLCEQPPSYWQAKYLALKPKIIHNKDRFRSYVQEQRNIIQRGIQCQI